MSSPQLWERLYHYIHEYQYLAYEYYAKDATAFLTTYYHLNSNETIWDNEYVMGGAYEEIGNLTGIRWDKILLLPVFFIDEISSIGFDASEIGQNKLTETYCVIPSEYGFTPLPHDIIQFEQDYLQMNPNAHPVYHVSGVEIAPNTDRRFWKLKLEVDQSRKIPEVDNQTLSTYMFFDYAKQIHTIDNANILLNLLETNSNLKKIVKNLYDEHTGFYLI